MHLRKELSTLNKSTCSPFGLFGFPFVLSFYIAISSFNTQALVCLLNREIHLQPIEFNMIIKLFLSLEKHAMTRNTLALQNQNITNILYEYQRHSSSHYLVC